MTHLAGPEEPVQLCSHCGALVQISSRGKPFPEGSRVGVITLTRADVFSPYLAGANDSNPKCWQREGIA